jgi:hypothetical protein
MYRGGGKQGKPYISCLTWRAGHPMLEYKTALELVSSEIAAAIRIEAVTPSITPASWDSDLQRLTSQRTRVQEGYEAGIYNSAEAFRKINAVEKQIDGIKRKIHEVEKGASRRKTLLALAQQSAASLENWVKSGNAAEVNRVLHSIISRVIISPDRTVQKIEFR